MNDKKMRYIKISNKNKYIKFQINAKFDTGPTAKFPSLAFLWIYNEWGDLQINGPKFVHKKINPFQDCSISTPPENKVRKP